MVSQWAALLAAALVVGPASAQAALPHLIFNLIDDFGWANVGFHRPAGFNETVTPNSEDSFSVRATRARSPPPATAAVAPPSRRAAVDALVASGVLLDQYYVHKYCSPSRSSYQTGRMPIQCVGRVAPARAAGRRSPAYPARLPPAHLFAMPAASMCSTMMRACGTLPTLCLGSRRCRAI